MLKTGPACGNGYCAERDVLQTEPLHIAKKGGKLGRTKSTAKTKIACKASAGGTAVCACGVNSSDATTALPWCKRRVVWRKQQTKEERSNMRNAKNGKGQDEANKKEQGPVDDRKKQEFVNGGRRKKKRSRKTKSGRYRIGIH